MWLDHCQELSLSCDLKVSVLLSYVRSVSFRHRVELWGKAGKKNSALGVFCLVCFARPVSWNTTPSGVYLLNRRSNLARSADLDGLVRQKSLLASMKATGETGSQTFLKYQCIAGL